MLVLIVLCSQIDVIIIILIILIIIIIIITIIMKIIIIIIVIKAELFLTNINTVNALFVFDAL